MEEFTTMYTVAHVEAGQKTANQARAEVLADVQAIDEGAEATLLIYDRFAFTFRVVVPWSVAAEAGLTSLFGARNVIRK